MPSPPPDPYGRAARVTVLVGDGAVTVAAIGRLEGPAAAAFGHDLLEVWPVCAGGLTVDLTACRYLSHGAIRALQTLSARPSPRRGELRVIAVPDVIAGLDAANIRGVCTPAAPTIGSG